MPRRRDRRKTHARRSLLNSYAPKSSRNTRGCLAFTANAPLNRLSAPTVARRDRRGRDLRLPAHSGAPVSSAAGSDATFSAACPSVARAATTCATSAANASIKSESRASESLSNSSLSFVLSFLHSLLLFSSKRLNNF